MIKQELLALVPNSKTAIFKSAFLKIVNLLLNIRIIFCLVDSLTTRKFDWIILLYILLKSIIVYLEIQATQRISTLVKISLRGYLLDRLFSSGMRDDKTLSSATIAQVSTDGIEQLDSYYSLYYPQFIYSMIAPLILFFVIRVYSLKIAVVLLLGVPLIPISIVAIQKIAKRILNKYWDSYTQLGDSFLENVQGLTDLKIYGVDEQKSKEMEIESESFRQATMRVLVMQLNSIAMMDLVAYGGAMVAVVLSYYDYSMGLLSVYGMLIVILLSAEFFLPMRRLGSYFHVAMNGIAAHERLKTILGMESFNREKNQCPIVNELLRLENVAYSYSDFKLKKISLTINRGSLIALVGRSGSGKSTVAQLIMNDISPIEGDITLYERPFNHKDIYSDIVYLGSEAFIIKGTLADNLKIKENYTDQECRMVLDKLKLEALSLDMEIEERGANLSGGEKQRIAFARALLLNPSIYVLDEFTSSLDLESEKIVLDLVEELLAKDKGVLMISHQLKNIEKADEIIVIESGRIIERGVHQDLLNNQSTYTKLYKQQETYLSFLNEEVYYE